MERLKILVTLVLIVLLSTVCFSQVVPDNDDCFSDYDLCTQAAEGELVALRVIEGLSDATKKRVINKFISEMRACANQYFECTDE